MQSHSKHSSDSNSLSHSLEINERNTDGMGTATHDRTLKKRLQNRIAQRSYRQRMKDRVADLQSKLQVCEKQLQCQEVTQSESIDAGMPGVSSLARHASSSCSPVASPTATVRARIDEAAPSCVELEPIDLSAEVNHLSNSFLIEHGDQNNSLWPYAQVAQYCEDTQLEVCDDVEENDMKAIDSESDSLALEQRGVALESYLASLASGLSNDPLAQLPCAYTSPQPNTHEHRTSGISMPHDVAFMTPISSSQAHALSSTSLDGVVEKRISGILKDLELAGFNDFDDLFQTYYGSNFTASSLLSDEQRLSRNRRLPSVMASLFRAAKTWSAWEARGLYEETLKATEEILMSETLEAGNDIKSEVINTLGSARTATSDFAVLTMSLRKRVQSKLPNLWAMVMALAASTKPIQANDSSRTAIAAIVLLQCAGHVEKDSVIELVRLCL